MTTEHQHLRWEQRRDNADAGQHVAGYRYDRAGEALLAPTVTSDGTLLISGRVAKPGVLRYVDFDGNVRRELVPAAMLHDSASLGTLGRAPVTLEHPDQDVVPDNVAQFGVGDVDGEVRVESAGYVTVRMAVRRADAIRAVRDGKVELSPGYRVLVDPTPGVHPEFGAYDAVQIRRDYNHVAIVDAARGGHDVRLRTDAAYQLVDASDAADNKTNDTGGDANAATRYTPNHDGRADARTGRKVTMNPLLIALLASLGIERYDNEDVALEQARQRADELRKRADQDEPHGEEEESEMDALRAKIDELATAVTALTTERDELKGQVDAHAAEREAADKAAADAALKSDRDALVHLADRLGVNIAPEVKADSADGLESHVAALRRDVARIAIPDLADDADDAYVRGIVSTIARKHGDAENNGDTRTDARGPWRQALGGGDTEGDTRAPANRRGDADDETPTHSYYRRADAAFNAARSGNEPARAGGDR